MMSIHQFIFFVCTSGLVGLTLGILRYRFKNITCIVLLSSLSLTIAICFIYYVIGIPVFGFALQGNMIIQILIVWGASLIITILYFFLLEFIYKKVPIDI
jgi:hypothetical protein